MGGLTTGQRLTWERRLKRRDSNFSNLSMLTDGMPFSAQGKSRLESSIARLAERNDALGMAFREEGGGAEYGYAPAGTPEFLEFSGQAAAFEWIVEQNGRVCDPLDGALCRFYMLRYGDALRAFIKSDSLVTDAYSLSVIKDVLDDDAAGREALFYPSGSYDAYAESEREYLKSARRREDGEAWARLIKAPAHMFDLLEGGPGGDDFVYVLNMDEPLRLEYLQLCADHRMTVFGLAALCWHCVLELYTGRGDVGMCYTRNGRDATTRSILGHMVDTVPLPFNNLAKGSLGRAVDSFRESIAQASAAGRYGIQNVAADMRARGLDTEGLMSVAVSDISGYGFPSQAELSIGSGAMYPLEVFVNVGGRGEMGHIFLRCSGDFISGAAAEKLGGAFLSLIHSLYSYWNRDILDMDIFNIRTFG